MVPAAGATSAGAAAAKQVTVGAAQASAVAAQASAGAVQAPAGAAYVPGRAPPSGTAPAQGGAAPAGVVQAAAGGPAPAAAGAAHAAAAGAAEGSGQPEEGAAAVAKGPCCRVPGCTQSLRGSGYHMKNRICALHQEVSTRKGVGKGHCSDHPRRGWLESWVQGILVDSYPCVVCCVWDVAHSDQPVHKQSLAADTQCQASVPSLKIVRSLPCHVLQASQVELPDGSQVRFCRRCRKLHPLEDFDGDKGSCRHGLAWGR